MEMEDSHSRLSASMCTWECSCLCVCASKDVCSDSDLGHHAAPLHSPPIRRQESGWGGGGGGGDTTIPCLKSKTQQLPRRGREAGGGRSPGWVLVAGGGHRSRRTPLLPHEAQKKQRHQHNRPFVMRVHCALPFFSPSSPLLRTSPTPSPCASACACSFGRTA